MSEEAVSHLSHRVSVLMELEKFDESLISYDKAIELDNCDKVTYEGKGNVLMKKNSPFTVFIISLFADSYKSFSL